MTLREFAGPVGRLEALLDRPRTERRVNDQGLVEEGRTSIRAAVVLGHPLPPQGGTMHTKVLYQAAKALTRIGCVVLRFNFRGVGTSAGQFDEGSGEQDDFRAALDFMRSRFPGEALWAGGVSFGAYVGMTAAADDPRVSTLLGISTPFNRYDFARVRDSATPKFFIHGERDAVCPLRQAREFYARAADPKELVVIDSADHLFDGKVTEVVDAVEDLFSDWPE